MKKYTPIIFLGSIFFIFLIGRVWNAYDRIHPQFFYLGLCNLAILSYVFYKFSLDSIYNIVKKSRLLIFYFIYIVISTFSVIVATNKVEALITLSQYFTFFFSFFAIILISSLYKINYLKTLIYFSAIALVIESIGVLYSVFDYVYINGNDFTRRNDYSGFAGNINITAFSLVIKSSFIYFLLFNKENKIVHDILYISILFLVSTSLFFLLTRGALLAFSALSILIIIYILFTRFKSKVAIRKILILGLALVSSYLITTSIMLKDNSSNLIVDRVATISLDTQDESIGQRLRYYNLTLTIIGDNLLTGIGIGNWKFKSIEYDAPNIVEYTIPYHTHNDFLQVASEIGLFGFTIFFSLFIIPIMGLIKKIIYSTDELMGVCLLGAFIVYFIDSMLNFPISRPISHIYFLFILMGYQSLIETR